MFWIAFCFIVASFIGFVTLRLSHAPEGEEDEQEYAERHAEDVEEYGEEEAAERDRRLTLVKYATFGLMGAGFLMFLIYAFSTV